MSRYLLVPPGLSILSAIDAAVKTGVGNDYSVIATIGTDFRDFYVLDIVRERVEFVDLMRLAMQNDVKWNPQVLYVEDASSGSPLIQTLRSRTGIPVVAVPPKGSKVARAEAVTNLFESGRVKFPQSASWLEPLIEEFCAFPAGRHDDQVDALCLALAMARDHIARARAHRPPPRGFFTR